MPAGIATFLISIPILLIGCFTVRKKTFIHTDEFNVYKNFSPFPPIVTFWLLKLLLIILGIGLTFVGIWSFF
ncbi:MAG: hypothetical protein N2A99_05565 [Carnobacterium alterfunditum]